MSRSRPDLKNPATRFIDWKGGADAIGKDDNGVMQYEGGKLVYWDRDANDGEGESIEVDMPFTFLVLDLLNTITGFNKATNSGYWSNEVKNLSKDELVVRNKNGIVARGLYKNIKDEIKAQGAKFTASIYIAFYNEEKELVIGHLKLAGGALNEWIEFNKRVDVMDCAITMSVNPKIKTNGTTKYFVPAFESMKISTATGAAADKLDDKLQTYLDVYFSRKPEEEAEITEDQDEDNTDIHNIAGVDSPAEAPQAAPQAAKPAETLDDGTSTDSEQEAPQKPSNKPATAAKTAKDDKVNLKDVEF